MVMKQEQKFLDAYDAYADAIFRHIFFRIRDREKARDLTQEVFIRVWNLIVRGEEVRHIRGLLYKVARNIVIDMTRKKHELSLEVMQESGYEPSESFDSNLFDAIDMSIIRKAMLRLSNSYQTVINLRYIDGLAPREIAYILDESVNVVSVRITRGIKELKKLL